MKNIDIEMLSAYLDKELSPDETSLIEERLAENQDLRLVLKQMRASNEFIRTTVSEIDKVPMSPKLDALMSSIDSGRSYVRQKQDSILSQLWFWAMDVRSQFSWSINAVATIVLLVGVAFYLNGGRHEHNLLQLDVGKPVPPSLAATLSRATTGSSLTISGVKVDQKLAFINQASSMCKQYSVSNQEIQAQAVACYENGSWVNIVAEKTHVNLGEDLLYRPASGSSGALVDAYIEDNIQGIPLSKEGEQAYLKGMGQ